MLITLGFPKQFDHCLAKLYWFFFQIEMLQEWGKLFFENCSKISLREHLCKIILKKFSIFLNRNVPQYFLQDVFLLKNHLTVEYNSHKIIKKSLMWSVQDTCICTLDRPLITRSRSRIWQSTFDSKASSKISSSVRCLKMLNIQNDDFLRASVRHNVWFWPLLYSLNYVLGYFSCSSKQP